MAKEYVEKRNGGYYIAGTRVSLDSVVYEFLRGNSPEGIQEAFPSMTLEGVYGSLAYYLANREEVEGYLTKGEQEFDEMRRTAREKNPLLHRKLEEARRSTQSRK